MEDVRDFFKENDSAFTIYVVEQRFVTGRGVDYFRSYKGKANYIDTDEVMKKRLTGILGKITKHIPNITELVDKCFGISNSVPLLDIISALSKLFSVNEHQAAGPDVIDPIIAPGVSIKASDGINLNEAYDIMRYVAENKNVVKSLDIVEYNPLKDIDNKTLKICCKLLDIFIEKNDD